MFLWDKKKDKKKKSTSSSKKSKTKKEVKLEKSISDIDKKIKHLKSEKPARKIPKAPKKPKPMKRDSDVDKRIRKIEEKVKKKAKPKKAEKPKKVTKPEKPPKPEKTEKPKPTPKPKPKKIKTHRVNIQSRKPPSKYFSTGIKGMDDLLGEGIPVGNSVLIEGGPGSGKTIFCLNIANNFCMNGKKVLYMSFEEPEERLINHMEKFGWNAGEYQKKGLLKVKRFDALDIARSVEALLSAAKKELLIDVHPVLIPEGFNPDLVLVDSLTSIASAFSGEESRFRVYMEQFFRYLEKSSISSILVREVSTPSHIGKTYVERGEAISFLSDGIIVVYNVVFNEGRRARAVEVLKMRGSSVKRKIVEMEINNRGITVYPDNMLLGKYRLT
jgi:KaiC/GvpD/RAD55 family RecA-like ATPase